MNVNYDGGKEKMKCIQSKVKLNGKPYTQEGMDACIKKGERILKEKGKDVRLFSFIGNMLSDGIYILSKNSVNDPNTDEEVVKGTYRI